MNIKQIVEKIGGQLDPDQHIDGKMDFEGVNAIDKAGPQEISFYLNPKLKAQAVDSQAGLIITKNKIEGCPRPQLMHSNPYAAMAQVSQLFQSENHEQEGISPQAFVHPSAKVADDAIVYPFAYVSSQSIIGSKSVLYPHTFVGEGVTIGESATVHPNVTIKSQCKIGNRVMIQAGAVIGGDGFGFAPAKDRIEKIPQLGNVIIEDDVEIGANCTIDRATFDSTIVRRGAKLDGQVHLGHNVEVGPWTMLCGQVGVGGSAKIGSWCIGAGKVAISSGVKIADRVILGARATALSDIQEPGEYLGNPAQPSMKWRREVAALKKIADLVKRVNKLETKI